MKNYQFEIEGREYDVVVESLESDQAQVRVDGTLYRVKLRSQAAQAPPDLDRGTGISSPVAEPPEGVVGPPIPKTGPAPAAGSGVIMAPMPGLITAVLVSQGEQVSAGQTLLRMEAMKMENEIPSPVDGVVQEVRVSEGAEVQENEVLVVVEASG